MTRKMVWLALPLVLAALIVGVKWRSDHPTPSKEDLEIRALMSKASAIKVAYYSPNRKVKPLFLKVSRQDAQPLRDSF